MAGQMKRGKKKIAVDPGFEPVREQSGHNRFEMTWMVEGGSRSRAFVRVPIIDTLLDTGKLTEAEYSSLAYYRDQAHKAEEDVGEENVLSPSKIMGGSSGSHPIGGYTPTSLLCTPAIIETGRIERDLGVLRDIARAVAVEDMSLSQWCIERHGGRERYDGKGKFIAIVPINEKKHIEYARMELRMAAHRISR